MCLYLLGWHCLVGVCSACWALLCILCCPLGNFLKLTSFCLFIYFYLKIFFFFLGPHLQHMEVPRLGIKSELQLQAHTTATAMQDLSYVYNLHHSPQQCQILNPMDEARDGTCNLMVPSQICFRCHKTETPKLISLTLTSFPLLLHFAAHFNIQFFGRHILQKVALLPHGLVTH